jgi:AcrR family transcriptional regulator
LDKESRNKLINAALPLFAEKGYAAVSIRELAAKARVNSALITYHFGGKENLYRAVLENQFNQLMELFSNKKYGKLTPDEKIRESVRDIIDFQSKNPFFRKLLFGELSHTTPSFEYILKDYSHKLYQIFHQILQDGVFKEYFRPDLDPTYALFAILGTISYYFIAHSVIQKAIPDLALDDHIFSEQAVEMIFHGIGGNKSRLP